MNRVPKYSLSLVKEGSIQYEPLSSPSEVYKLASSLDLAGKPEEEFWIACVDSKYKPIGLHMVSRGTLDSSLAHPREVFKRALLNNAAAIILMHNHPSGNPEPSNDDVKVTKRLREAGELLGIGVLDHVIIGDTSISMLERGLL